VALAAAHGVARLAFPAISTGIFRYPLDAACEVAVRALTLALPAAPTIERVSLVAFDERTASALRAARDAQRRGAPRAP